MTPNTDAIRWIFFDMGYTLINEDGAHYTRDLHNAVSTTHFRFVREQEAPFPASAETLARLHTRFKLGIIASQPGGSVDRLRRCGLLDHLDLVYSSSEIGLDKPDPAFFAAACRVAGCAPHEAIMVGDRLDNDIIPAKAIGMMTVRLRQGKFCLIESDDPAAQPDLDLSGIGELAKELLKE